MKEKDPTSKDKHIENIVDKSLINLVCKELKWQ